jgi:hypothetical protein
LLCLPREPGITLVQSSPGQSRSDGRSIFLALWVGGALAIYLVLAVLGRNLFFPIFCLLSLTRILLRSGNGGSHSPGKVPPHPILYCTVHSSFSALRTPRLSPFSLLTLGPLLPVLAQKSRFRKPEAAGSRRPPPRVSFVLVSCPRSALGVWSVVFLPWLSCPIVSFFRVYSIE